uniref:Uncharacterized protein n=1 Tax=Aegilops tauschii subsp. strangulata TaxID=200361 RepID=A0A452ZWG6_AEGTS
TRKCTQDNPPRPIRLTWYHLTVHVTSTILQSDRQFTTNVLPADSPVQDATQPHDDNSWEINSTSTIYAATTPGTAAISAGVCDVLTRWTSSTRLAAVPLLAPSPSPRHPSPWWPRCPPPRCTSFLDPPCCPTSPRPAVVATPPSPLVAATFSTRRAALPPVLSPRVARGISRTYDYFLTVHHDLHDKLS